MERPGSPGSSELLDPLLSNATNEPLQESLAACRSSSTELPRQALNTTSHTSPYPIVVQEDKVESFVLTFPVNKYLNEPHQLVVADGSSKANDCDVEMAKTSLRRTGCTKYHHALRVLVPCSCEMKNEANLYSHLDHVGCISFVLYSWMTALMWRSYEHGLRLQDMWKTSILDGCRLNTERLHRIWMEEVVDRGEQKASFFRACWRFCRTRLIVAGLIYWLCLCMGFLGPTLFVQKLIQQTENNDHSLDAVTYGIALVIGLASCELGRAMLFVTVWAINYRTCIRLKAACDGLVYRKIFELKNLHQSGSSSETITLISSDIQRIFDAVRQSLLMIGGPILMVGGTIYSVWLLGWMALVGAGLLILFYPVQAVLSKTLAKLRRRCVQKTEARIHLMTEIIDSIRLIKMCAWEELFCEKIVKIRKEEQRYLANTAWTQSTNLSLTPLVPVIAAVVTFLCHMAVGGQLLPTQAFNIMIIYYIIGSGGIRQIVLAFVPLISMRISCNRVQKFLLIQPVVRKIRNTKDLSIALHLENVDFSWEPLPDVLSDAKIEQGNQKITGIPAVLHKISMQVKTGTLVGLCGSVGCGKSSLFYGLLGQIYSNGGKFTMRGRLAYVSQQAWLVNDTVQENICFGEPYDYERYHKVVSVCHLIYDFAILPDGDQCVVGERGSTLSGGQRQRICLARAVYSNRDIFLLDDPLSSVDATVGAAIFEDCIMKYLRANGKTVLFISGKIQLLEQCDMVHVLKTGRIVQSGTHLQLISKKKGEYWEMVDAGKKEKNGLEEVVQGNRTDILQPIVQTTQVVVVEEKKKSSTSDLNDSSKGAMGIETYQRYTQAAGGAKVTVAVLLVFALNMGLNTFSSWWLSYWFNHGSTVKNITSLDNTTKLVHYVTLEKEAAWYPGIYAGAVGLVVLLSVFRSYFFMKVTLKAAFKLHQSAFKALMSAKMRFFDITSAGKVLNRMSKDIDEIDSQIPFVSELFLQNSMYCLFALLNIAILFPWLLIAIFIMAGILVWIIRRFRSGVRDFKRLENSTTSPIIGLVASTVQGLSIIQAYDRQVNLVHRFENLVDVNSFPLFCFHCAIRWLGLRLDFLTIAFTVCTALFIVLLPDQVTAAEAGLALSFAIQMSGLFQYTVRLALEMEGRFTSVDRIIDYIDNVPQEGGENGQDIHLPLPDNWPLLGRLVMDGVVLRYDVALTPALQGISFVAEPGERIGIVGRTGSGKSSLAAALFRLVEIESGQILIDGLSTKSINLRRLRSRLSIIPQDPVLFAGSLRYNLDPFEEYNDEQILDALKRVNLHQRIATLKAGLHFQVSQNGQNFSVGERQLICMARALLRQSRILFMDEATASIDSRTDSLLQETMGTAFHNCTVLTVAHRLNTVIHYDQILVLSDGKIVEFGPPSQLMANSNGVFAQMVSASLAKPS